MEEKNGPLESLVKKALADGAVSEELAVLIMERMLHAIKSGKYLHGLDPALVGAVCKIVAVKATDPWHDGSNFDKSFYAGVYGDFSSYYAGPLHIVLGELLDMREEDRH